MASAIDICNSALSKIGVKEISSFTDNSKEAKLCRRFYETSRDELLRSHPWNFAIKEAELTKLSEAPLMSNRYTSKFNLPTDCLRVLRTDDSYDSFKIKGRQLYGYDDTVVIEYLAKITDVSYFDSCFIEVLSWLIASKLAYPMVQSQGLADQIFRTYERQLRDARSFDGQEGTMEQLNRDDWLDSRRADFFDEVF